MDGCVATCKRVNKPTFKIYYVHMTKAKQLNDNVTDFRNWPKTLENYINFLILQFMLRCE